MHKSNIEARSPNQCCCGKAVIISYSDCGSVNLSYPACKAHAPNYIFVCGLSVLPYFSRYIINGTIFGKPLLKIKPPFDFPRKFRLKHFSFQEEFSETS